MIKIFRLRLKLKVTPKKDPPSRPDFLSYQPPTARIYCLSSVGEVCIFSEITHCHLYWLVSWHEQNLIKPVRWLNFVPTSSCKVASCCNNKWVQVQTWSLYVQVYKWVPANLILEVTMQRTTIRSRHRRPKIRIWGVIFFFFYYYAKIQRNVTCNIYCYLTIELEHAKRDSRATAYEGVVLQRLERLNL